MTNNQGGFTLIEVLMSVAIMAIGFAGVYILVGVSDQVLQNSIDREKLNYQANEIIETIHFDRDNLADYDNQNLGVTDCSTLTANSNLEVWCNRITAELGAADTLDKRIIYVEQQTVDSKEVNVVAIELSNKNGKNSVWVKKIFND